MDIELDKLRGLKECFTYIFTNLLVRGTGFRNQFVSLVVEAVL